MPTVIVAILLRGIDALKTFDILYATKGKGGGSFHEVETLNVYAYGLSFDYNEYGAVLGRADPLLPDHHRLHVAADHAQESGKQMTAPHAVRPDRSRRRAPARQAPAGSRSARAPTRCSASSPWSPSCSFLIAPLVWMLLASFKTNVDIYDTGKAFFFTPTVENYANVLQQNNYFSLHLQQLLGGLRLHRPVAGPGRPGRLLDEPVHHAPLGAGGADGPRHPGRLAAGALVLRLLQPEDGRRLQRADPQPHVRGAAADRLHHDGLLRFACRWSWRSRRRSTGSTPIGAFRRITLPLSVPGIATAGILSFIFSWNNFMFALVLSGANTKTLPVAIFDFVGYASIDWGGLMAAATVVTMPIMVIALFTQKYIVSGLTAGATKG